MPDKPEVPDLAELMATDAFLDQLAAGQHDPIDEPGLEPLVTLSRLSQRPGLPDPSPALRAAAAAGRALGALADRRFALRSLAAAAALVGVVSTGGLSAAVTGDPLYPVRSIIEQVSPTAPGERGKIPPYLVGDNEPASESDANGVIDGADLSPTDAPSVSALAPQPRDGQVADTRTGDRQATDESGTESPARSERDASGSTTDDSTHETASSGSERSGTDDATSSESGSGSDSTGSEASSTGPSGSGSTDSGSTGADGTSSGGSAPDGTSTGGSDSDGTSSDGASSSDPGSDGAGSGDTGSDGAGSEDTGSDGTSSADPGSDGTSSGGSGSDTTGSGDTGSGGGSQDPGAVQEPRDEPAGGSDGQAQQDAGASPGDGPGDGVVGDGSGGDATDDTDADSEVDPGVSGAARLIKRLPRMDG